MFFSKNTKIIKYKKIKKLIKIKNKLNYKINKNE